MTYHSTTPAEELTFLSRMNDQVQLRGHRIELGEIEAAALSDLGPGGDVTLQVHPALLALPLRASRPGNAALRRSALESGALVIDLDDRELLIRLQPALERAEPEAMPRNG